MLDAFRFSIAISSRLRAIVAHGKGLNVTNAVRLVSFNTPLPAAGSDAYFLRLMAEHYYIGEPPRRNSRP
jgi:hypothetical protein